MFVCATFVCPTGWQHNDHGVNCFPKQSWLTFDRFFGNRVTNRKRQHFLFLLLYLHWTYSPETHVSGLNRYFWFPLASMISYFGIQKHMSHMYWVLPNTAPELASFVSKYRKLHPLHKHGIQQQPTPHNWSFLLIRTTFNVLYSLLNSFGYLLVELTSASFPVFVH